MPGIAPNSATAESLFPFFQAHPVSYLSVQMQDGFWAPRQRTTRDVSVAWVTRAHDRAGGLAALKASPDDYASETTPGEMEHVKFLEAMASVVGVDEDPDIVSLIDAWAEPLIDGQAADGYLAERFPIGHSRPSLQRWAVVRGFESHEDYALGHYIEAAIAYHEATGRQELYESAVRAADNMADELLDSDRAYTSGHPEIEQALMRLYGQTGESRYLRLCGWLLDQRGHHDGRATYGRRAQDHLPLAEQHTIEGHAVCAAFLFNGATQYVGATGDERYRDAVLAVWDDLVRHKLFLHGAAGNLSARNEGYRQNPCDIAPDDCYGECCAAVANFRWAHSLFALTGEAHYLDTAERILYNAFPASLSLAGDSIFYTNVAQTGQPAVADGALTLTDAERRDTVRFSGLANLCCSPNVVKLINTVGGYFYSVDDAGIYVKHYGTCAADIPYGKGVNLSQRTDYPWDGAITLLVEPKEPQSFALRLRVPSWATEHELSVNGESLDLAPQNGWVTIDREWKAGDQVELSLPLRVERITMPPQFNGYVNRAALQRGPIVYCLEMQDLDESQPRSGDSHYPIVPSSAYTTLNSIYIPEDEEFSAQHLPDFLGGVTVLRGDVRQVDWSGDDQPVGAMFIPYCVWGNRTPSEMRIWLGASNTGTQLFFLQQAGHDVGLEDWA